MLYIGGASVLVIMALLLISLPWVMRPKRTQQDVLTNTRLVKHRLAELALEQQQGLLSDADLSQAENELKLALLDEVPESKGAQQQVSIILIVGLVIAVGISGTVYFQVNQLSAIKHWENAISRLPELGKSINSNQDINAEDLQDFALGLRTKLHQEPDNAVGWMLLGRMWGALNQPQTAKEAFEKSLDINPDSVGALLSYAQALILLGAENDLLQAQRVLSRVIEIDPTNINGIGTLAIVATELGDKQQALENWLKLKAVLPEGDANYAAVTQKISELSGISGANELAVASDTSSSAADTGTRVAITVQLDESLRAKIPAQGVLFVFAQDASGQVRMPAAVVKLPLSDFPLTIELSDANAMMKNYTLSGLEQAKLVARISLDENVVAAQGELQGEVMVTLLKGKLSVATINIDKEVM